MNTRALLPLFGGILAACTTGQGSGSVSSDRLYVQNCWDGPFDLQPTFFASDPSLDTQQIRIQRGDQNVGVSDGVLIVVDDVSKIRSSGIGTEIPLGLPIGVNPPGFPKRVEASPLQVSLTLYLYGTCHLQDGAVYSVGGNIVFDHLFSGNRNENNADDRLTSGHFEAIVADPRDGILGSGAPNSGGTPQGDAAAPLASGDAGAGIIDADGGDLVLNAGGVEIEYPERTGRCPACQGSASVVRGNFRFYFQRGVPAQPFP